MTILVTGARGHVGRGVVNGLLAAGARARAMSRNPGSIRPRPGLTVVGGDLEDPEGLAPALSGVDSMFLFPVARTAAAVLDHAKRAGVRHVVVLSSNSVPYAYSHNGRYHKVVEDAVRGSGLDWTFVRPGEFATNLLWKWCTTIRANGVVRAPFPEARQTLLHEADVAAVATVTLLQPGHESQIYDLTGPHALTQREQTEALSQALGRPLRFEEISPREAKAEMTRFMPEPAAALALAYLADAAAHIPTVTRTVARLTGRPGLPFTQWAHDHAPEFSL
ncbi:NAD(P)H-binding protein [Actinokineospora enzanensis]|uniref:NAD(P)H-binding protein n=1 Tax=Actinokineospora enzanensis TaxID=155975 RepID=UPI00037A853B|nr:NAD(P)H-binding protein [Actinokineospora enzanensis]